MHLNLATISPVVASFQGYACTAYIYAHVLNQFLAGSRGGAHSLAHADQDRLPNNQVQVWTAPYTGIRFLPSWAHANLQVQPIHVLPPTEKQDNTNLVKLKTRGQETRS